MKQIILGTAGHIDHGKTTLIRAVTGINTDRLKEEQLRGITIELGFASMDLPSGQHLGIVDVPGHEKFVKNMVAGASGMDLVAMVIAADEGVMPQTREHMEICSLLDIRHGFVVLTKTDLVDEEWLELVTDDVEQFVRGTFLEGSPIVPVSAETGEGIDRFVATLDEFCKEVPSRQPTGVFRLPVDRVFTMRGFGTVITGTLISGRVGVGDPVVVFPSGVRSKVRGIQVHNDSVGEAVAGQRTAINFQGLEKASVERGNVVSEPSALRPSYMIDVSLNYLASNRKPAKNRQRVRCHTGTSEVLGVLALLEADELAPGGRTVAQLRLDAPVSVVKDDRFVIRSYSPVRTIGGGRVLNPIPVKHRRLRPDVVEGLKQLMDSGPEDAILYFVKSADYRGVSLSDLKVMTNLSDKVLDSTLQALMSKQVIVQVDKESRIFIHSETVDALRNQARDRLKRYHKENPLRQGMPKEELKSKFPATVGGKLFTYMLNLLVREEAVAVEENTVRLAGHKISLGGEQSDIRKKILETYRASGLQPPYFREFVQTHSLDARRAGEVLRLLVEEGGVVRVKEDLYFHQDAVEELRQRLVDFLSENEEIATPQFKEMTGASRKYVIPLLEYFDARNVTIRIGDIRKLRKSG
ncbi:MAG: selenocysteine-specific translation elongation factor [Desulfobacteraceae bacterium]|nr:selenocysteine-specific translation elongation factor [Desulfobacteraceae bacterium]